MEKGARVLRTENYYDPDGGQVEIPLDPLKTPQQNAARYYKNYTKAKTAETMLTLQLEKGAQEAAYLDSVLDSVSRAEGDRDLEEIRQELVETGYLRRRAKAKDRMKRPGAKPLEFRSTAGLRISVGRNNLQNDRLTTKQAGKWDYWFHTQKIHGAHVILWTEGRQPDPGEIREETRRRPAGDGGLHHLSDRLCGPGPRLGGHAACMRGGKSDGVFCLLPVPVSPVS